MPADRREDSPSCAQTRRRLLDAAGEVFAEKGFRAATTREICRRAGANVAAVNYHFRDKEGLYEAVLQYAHRQADDAPPRERTAEAAAPAAERLHGFVEWFLLHLLSEGRPAWQVKLLAREMMEPTGALDALVQNEFRPVADAAEALCAELLGPGSTTQQARSAARSVIAQCVYYRQSQPVLARICPDEDVGPERIRRLAHHITEFSLGGLARLARSGARTAKASASRRKRDP